MKTLKPIAIASLALSLASPLHALAQPANFACPAASSITALALPFPPPFNLAFWFAPQVPGSDSMGNGLGGSSVGNFIGASPATVNGKPGWMCYYGSSAHAYGSELANNLDKLPANVRGLAGSVSNNTGVGMVAYQAN
jgi:hypothetical protein